MWRHCLWNSLSTGQTVVRNHCQDPSNIHFPSSGIISWFGRWEAGTWTSWMKSQTRQHTKWCSPKFMQHFSLWAFYIRSVRSIMSMRATIALKVTPSSSWPPFHLSACHNSSPPSIAVALPTHSTTGHVHHSFQPLLCICSTALQLLPVADASAEDGP